MRGTQFRKNGRGLDHDGALRDAHRDHDAGIRGASPDHNASIRGRFIDRNADTAAMRPLEQARRFYEAAGDADMQPDDRSRFARLAISYLILAAERGECDGSPTNLDRQGVQTASDIRAKLSGAVNGARVVADLARMASGGISRRRTPRNPMPEF